MRAHAGDVRRRDRVKLEEADAKVQGGHAFKVMAAYEKWLAGGRARGREQLALLKVLGLFDRPADPGCLRALRQEPAVAHLTEPLVGLSDADYQLVVSDLVDAGLVKSAAYEPVTIRGYSEEQANRPRDKRGEPERFEGPDTLGLEGAAVLDVHPLLREYFGHQVRGECLEAFRAGHKRLYEYLQRSVPYWPEGAEGLGPLFQAVAHGCQAGLFADARANVFRDRIQRGDEFYSTRKLGAVGADFGAVAWFFEEAWRRVSSSLSEADQSWILNEAAFDLRALGRLREAVEPMRAGLDTAVAQEDWKNAATRASNLSELELMQAQRQPQYPLLYSLSGFVYSDALLAEAERAAWLGKPDEALARSCEAMVRRASQTLEWAERHAGLLTVALEHFTLGRAELYRSMLGLPAQGARENAIRELDVAVNGLRAAGEVEFIVRGLLSRAWLRALEGNALGAPRGSR
ncbi:MAG: hypothetical protein JW940_20235 [Polyangiaceae bacterium]|nr:hypothetical protein [Polyangiaceae bacterium]